MANSLRVRSALHPSRSWSSGLPARCEARYSSLPGLIGAPDYASLLGLPGREQIIEPSEDCTPNSAIHQCIDRSGNDRARTRTRMVTRVDGRAELKKRLTVAWPDQVGCGNDEYAGAP